MRINRNNFGQIEALDLDLVEDIGSDFIDVSDLTDLDVDVTDFVDVGDFLDIGDIGDISDIGSGLVFDAGGSITDDLSLVSGDLGTTIGSDFPVLDVGGTVVYDIGGLKNIPILGDIFDFLGDLWESGGKDIFLGWLKTEILGKGKGGGGIPKGSPITRRIRIRPIDEGGRIMPEPERYPYPLVAPPPPVVVIPQQPSSQDDLIKLLLYERLRERDNSFELKPEYIVIGIGALALLLALTMD